MKIAKFLLTASTLALLSVPAFAGNNEGVYLGAHGGFNAVNDHATKTDTTRDNPTEYDNGYLAGGSIGYNFGNGIRNELEATYRDNDLDKIGGTGGVGGDVKSWTFMYNALYDLDVLGDKTLLPYVGVGAGAVRSKLDSGSGFAFGAVDDHDWNFALQGIAGVQYNLDYNWGVFADYRYLTTFHNKYDAAAAVGGVKTDYNNNSVVLGLRYTFGSPTMAATPEPAPAPMPMAAPAPARTEESAVSRKYLVFFDFNKATLTPEAVDVLKQAASDASNGKAVALEVSGHTDTSGSNTYNQKLSAKRAATVKAELTKLGITSSSVTTAAKGESDPLVPTGDGVKEPQNRRAEITYVIQPQR